MFPTVRPAVALPCALLALAAAVPVAQAADPQSFGSLSVECYPDDGSRTWTGDVVSDGASEVLVRYTASPGTAIIDGHSVAPGETVWQPTAALAAGDKLSATVACGSNSLFTKTYFGRPTLPSVFRGTGSAGGSVVAFNTASPGRVRAIVTTTGAGSLELSSSESASAPQRIDGATDASYDLGSIAGSAATLAIRTLTPERPTWKVRLEHVKPTKPTVTLAGPTGRAGTPVALDWTTADAVVAKLVVRDSGNRIVREISGGQLQPGAQSIAWDRTISGTPAPDGTYSLALTVSNAGGEASSTLQQASVDTTAPSAQFIAGGGVVHPRSDVKGLVADSPGGVASVSATSPSSTVPARITGAQFVLGAPRGGWTPGRHVVRVTVADRLGNAAVRELAFTATHSAPVTPARTCTVAGAGDAVTASSLDRAVTGLGGAPLMDRYAAAKVLCKSLDGDKLGDMVVLLRHRSSKSAKPVLAVFRGSKAGAPWRLAGRITGKTITAATVKRKVVRAAIKGGGTTEIRWNGKRFVTKVSRPAKKKR